MSQVNEINEAKVHAGPYVIVHLARIPLHEYMPYDERPQDALCGVGNANDVPVQNSMVSCVHCIAQFDEHKDLIEIIGPVFSVRRV
jgi:hypothetical protein